MLAQGRLRPGCDIRLVIERDFYDQMSRALSLNSQLNFLLVSINNLQFHLTT